MLTSYESKKFKKLGLIKPYIRDIQLLSLYLRNNYKDKRLLIYGIGMHTKELLDEHSYYNIVGAIGQNDVGVNHNCYDLIVKIFQESDIDSLEFDFLVLLGWWSDENIKLLLQKLCLPMEKIIAPYKNKELHSAAKTKFLKQNALKLSKRKPNLVLILTSDMKDLVTIASKELSIRFNLIKIYTSGIHLFVSKENGNFNQIISLKDGASLLGDLFANNPPPEIVFYWSNSQQDAWLGWFVKSVLSEKTKFILGTTDFFYTKVFQMPQKELIQAFNCSKEHFDLNKICEAKLIKYSDAIVTNFAGQYADDILLERSKKLHFNIGFVRSENCRYFKKKLDKNNIKTCYAGGISSSNDYRSHAITTFGAIFENIAKQDVGISVFSYFNLQTSPIYKPLIDKYSHLSWENFITPDLLIKELSAYDFGLLFYNLTPQVQKSHKMPMKSIFQAKLITYLCAGIPVIVNKEWTILSDFVEKHGVGLAVKFEDQDKIKQIILDSDYSAMKKNVYNFQKRYAKDNQQKLLANFCFSLLA